MEIMRRLYSEEEGQGLVEYVLIIAIISLVLIIAGPTVADAIEGKFGEVGEALAPAAP